MMPPDIPQLLSLDVEAKKFEKRKLKFGDIILEKSGGGSICTNKYYHRYP